MDWLQSVLADWFPLLAMFAFTEIVFGFAGHSIGLNEPDDSPPSARRLANRTIVFATLSVGWGFLAWNSFRPEDGITFAVAGYAFATICCVIEALRSARRAMKAA